MATTLLFVVACMLSLGNCHVRLTFPPARQYALDFLDNVRTTAPCGGMNFSAGYPITTLEAGLSFAVTWHLAYPHLGGYRLQLLNATTGKVSHNLTGPDYQSLNDSTVISHNVMLEEAMMCDHCVLRLIRQAGEWTAGGGGEYLFWSCADVKIIPKNDSCYAGECLNGGTCNSGTCTCPSKYEGSRCQYKNDCEVATDCNSNGECIDIEATSYPKKVCFCNAGKRGRFCSANSAVTNAQLTDTELNAYYHIQMMANPQFDVYWRLLGEGKDEIEVALRVYTNTWAAIGWRPNSLDSTCSDFPVTTGNNPVPEPEAEPPATSGRRRRDVWEMKYEPHQEVFRKKRAAERNVVKELCLAGNTTGASAWAATDFNADSSGVPVPEGEPAAPEPEPEGTPEPEGEAAATLHPMDCQDVVTISAVGNRHRILDSYTRDRSTPRPDSFYDGRDDLTAAAAKRVDGVLHAIFRRKLVSTDKADHTFTDTNFRFIWARGQDPKRFFHNPQTGLETCRASDYDYYRINELQYHGTKDTQRGSQTFNVYNNPGATETAKEGSLGSPKDCTGNNCNYQVSWRYRKSLKTVQFTVAAKVSQDKWAALGFSEDRNMINTDAVVGWMNTGATFPTVTDRHINARTAAGVILDSSQDITVISGSYSNGFLTFTFSRALNTMDAGKDKPLTQCVYLLMAWGGGYDGNNLSSIHTEREVSPNLVCFSSSVTVMYSWLVLVLALVASRIGCY